jgi:hypothetical protein
MAPRNVLTFTDVAGKKLDTGCRVTALRLALQQVIDLKTVNEI